MNKSEITSSTATRLVVLLCSYIFELFINCVTFHNSFYVFAISHIVQRLLFIVFECVGRFLLLGCNPPPRKYRKHVFAEVPILIVSPFLNYLTAWHATTTNSSTCSNGGAGSTRRADSTGATGNASCACSTSSSSGTSLLLSAILFTEPLITRLSCHLQGSC